MGGHFPSSYHSWYGRGTAALFIFKVFQNLLAEWASVPRFPHFYCSGNKAPIRVKEFNMKQILGFVMLAACSLGMSSCGIDHSQYAADIIPWVYDNAWYSYGKVKDLFEEQRDKDFLLEYKFIGDSSDDYEYFAFCVLSKSVYSFAELSLTDIEEWVNTLLTESSGNVYYDGTYYERDLRQEDWAKNYTKVYNDLFLSDIKTTAINIQNYWKPWEEYHDEYALTRTQILDQGFDSNNIGELYTGYYAVYALTGVDGEVKYALVSITEYDDDSRYEYQLIATADSLKEINQYFE